MVLTDIEETAGGSRMSFGVIMQFMIQTFLIAILAILFLGNIIPSMIFGSNLFANVNADTLAHRDAMWNWSIIIFIGAIAGNVIWLYRELHREQSYDVEV